MPTKPMARSLKHLRENGWQAAPVERWKPVFDKKTQQMRPFGVRVDCFGFGDILACRALPDPEIALFQTTDLTSFAKHKLKILSLPEFWNWKKSGGLTILHAWGKRGARGERKRIELREEIL